jgi:cation diffusion facilitator family transporter
MKENYPGVKKILYITLFLNLFVAVLKAVFGFAANSISMMADAAHSVFDSSSNIIGLIAVQVASKPPDKKHPYGHGKYEILATAAIGLLLFLTAWGIVGSVIERVAENTAPNITALTFAVMALTTVFNMGVSSYEKKKAVELSSPVLSADADHTRSDIYASAAVIAGFIAVKLGYPMFDPVIALLIAAIILITGYRIIRGASTILADESPIDYKIVAEVVKETPGVVECHKIRARGSENEVYVDLHVLVSADMHVDKAHRISEDVQKAIFEKIPQIKDVVVHIEPARGKTPSTRS